MAWISGCRSLGPAFVPVHTGRDRIHRALFRSLVYWKRTSDTRRDHLYACRVLGNGSQEDFFSPVESAISSFRVDVLDISGSIANAFCDTIIDEGASSATAEEYRPRGAEEEAIFAHDNVEALRIRKDGDKSQRMWKRCKLVIHFPSDMDRESIEKCMYKASSILGLDNIGPLHVSPVRAQDWEQVIRDSFQPMQVTDSVWIIPSWSEPVDRNAVNIILEPGLAFGTGHHPTTHLCLSWLELLRSEGILQTQTRVMDYGTGSGVLACAACLLGAGEAIGVDIEDQSIISAKQNAEANGIADETKFFKCLPDASLSSEPLMLAGIPKEHRKFDIVIANILSGPLQQLAPRLTSYVLPGSLLALSGILDSQVETIIETYTKYGIGDFNVKVSGDWAFLSGKKLH